MPLISSYLETVSSEVAGVAAGLGRTRRASTAGAVTSSGERSSLGGNGGRLGSSLRSVGNIGDDGDNRSLRRLGGGGRSGRRSGGTFGGRSIRAGIGTRISTTLNSLGDITASTISATADSTTGDDIRTRHDIVRGRASPEAEVHSSVVLLVDTRDRDRSTGDSGSAVTSDLNLSTGIVELSLAVVSTVKTNVLTTDEVLSIRESRRNLEVHRILVPRAPSSGAERLGVSRLADQSLVNLVPLEIIRAVLSSIRDRSGVDLGRTGVLHSSTAESLLKTNLVAGLDLEDVGSGDRALVAGEVLVGGRDRTIGDVLELGGHVAVLVLADVLVITTLKDAAEGELVESVVSADGGGQAEKSGNISGGLHGE
jgi:hypothetical protein